MKLSDVDTAVLLALSLYLEDTEFVRISLLNRKLNRKVKSNLVLENRLLRGELRSLCGSDQKQEHGYLDRTAFSLLPLPIRIRFPRKKNVFHPLLRPAKIPESTSVKVEFKPMVYSLTPQDQEELNAAYELTMKEIHGPGEIEKTLIRVDDYLDEKLDGFADFVIDMKDEVGLKLRMTGRGIKRAVRDLFKGNN